MGVVLIYLHTVVIFTDFDDQVILKLVMNQNFPVPNPRIILSVFPNLL